MTKRRNFSDNFKASVALEALRGDKRVQVIEGMAVGFDRATLDLMHEIDRIFTKYPFLDATISERIYLNQGSLLGDAACAT